MTMQFSADALAIDIEGEYDIKDGELHHAWKEQSQKAGFSMEFYILQALKEKIERDK